MKKIFKGLMVIVLTLVWSLIFISCKSCKSCSDLEEELNGLKEVENYLNEKQNELTNLLNVLKTSYETELTKLQAEDSKNSQAITDLTNAYNSKTEELKSDYNTKFSEIETSLNLLKNTSSNNTDKINELIEKVTRLMNPDEFTVTFITNTDDVIQNQGVKKGEKIRKPATPTKEGYTFLGWYIDDEKWLFNGNVVTEDINLEAKWKLNYSFYLENSVQEGSIYKIEVSTETATLNFNNYILVEGYENYYICTSEDLSTEINNHTISLQKGDNIYYILCEKDNGLKDSYKVNIYRRNKYKVVFNTNCDESIDDIYIEKGEQVINNYNLTKTWYIFNGWDYDFKTSITSDVIANALWELETYNITYVLNGGVNNIDNPTTYYFTSKTIVLNNPIKEEETFNGWYKDELFNQRIEKIEKGSIGNITLYAKFTINQYTLTFNTNGGTEIEAITADYGSKFNVSTTKNYYVFDGWYEDASFDTKFDLSTIPNKDITLYAKWKPKEFTIDYFLYDGVNNKGNPQKITVDEGVIKLKDPIRKGYSFVGWYTSKDFNESLKVDEISCKTYNDNITLYARWHKITYSVTYVLNGGKFDSEAINEFGYDDYILFNIPQRDGYYFSGWYDDNNYLVKENAIYNRESDIVLYAKWLKLNEVFTENSKEYIYFGSYPKSKVQEDEISSYVLNNLMPNSEDIYEYNGWKLKLYNNELFYYEPICWLVVENNAGKLTLVAKDLIDCMQFDSHSSSRYVDGKEVTCSNYVYSDIRNWLNSDFYYSAFVQNERKIILNTEVDNKTGVSSTHQEINTSDKVYLLSKSETATYELKSISAPSDYAAAKGITKYGRWWLRTPNTDSRSLVVGSTDFEYVSSDGQMLYYKSTNSGTMIGIKIECPGVRPVIQIDLNIK